MAFRFVSASNGYLKISACPVTGPPFTLGCWARRTVDNSSAYVAFSIGEASGGDYHAIQMRGAEGGDPIWASSTSGGTTNAATTAGWALNRWHYLCGVWTADNDRAITIDGGSRGIDTTSKSFTTGTIAVGVSADSTPFGYLTGDIAVPAIWNAALSQHEQWLLAQGVPPIFIRPQNLVWWPLDRSGFEWQRRYDLIAFNSPEMVSDPPTVREYLNRVRMRAVSNQGITSLVSWSIPNIWTASAKPPGAPVVVIPDPAGAVGAAVDPTVILGNVSVTPAAAASIGAVVDPDVVQGNVSVTPAAAASIGAVVDPDVELGAVSVTPVAAASIGAVVDPDVIKGGVSVTPVAAASIGTVVDPDVALGSLSVTPVAAASIGAVVDPDVLEGGVTVTPVAAWVVGAVAEPDVVLGNVSVTPAAAWSVGAVGEPIVIEGALSIGPEVRGAVEFVGEVRLASELEIETRGTVEFVGEVRQGGELEPVLRGAGDVAPPRIKGTTEL